MVIRRSDEERGSLLLDTLIAMMISVIILAATVHMLTPTTPKYGTESGALLAAAIAEAQTDATSTNKTQTVLVLPYNSTTTELVEGAGNPYIVANNRTSWHVYRFVPEVITASNGTITYTGGFSISAVSNGTLTMGPFATMNSAAITTNPGCTYVNTLTVTMGPETLTAVCSTGVVTTDFPSNA